MFTILFAISSPSPFVVMVFIVFVTRKSAACHVVFVNLLNVLDQICGVDFRNTVTNISQYNRCRDKDRKWQVQSVCDRRFGADMETLAKQIELRMHGEWKHALIDDRDLERIWPINEQDRQGKIAQFAKEYGFRLRFYKKGLCAIFDRWPPEQRT